MASRQKNGILAIIVPIAQIKMLRRPPEAARESEHLPLRRHVAAIRHTSSRRKGVPRWPARCEAPGGALHEDDDGDPEERLR